MTDGTEEKAARIKALEDTLGDLDPAKLKEMRDALEKTARDSFAKYAIIATLLAILGGVGATVWQRYDLMTAPSREAQESLQEYHRATEKLRRLQQEGQ